MGTYSPAIVFSIFAGVCLANGAILMWLAWTLLSLVSAVHTYREERAYRRGVNRLVALGMFNLRKPPT